MINHQFKRKPKRRDPRYDWRTVFLKNSGGISSKRIIALVGVLISFILLIVAFIEGREVPEFGEVVFIGCLSLYGVEAIPNFWQKNINKS